jgi:segregation and condensation protein A
VDSTYTIRINAFEGPFDLLLFFIERDELDIYDIPIAKITDDFLAYVHTMENLNIDLASEFILVAATLMRIKAKMLIPRKEVDEQGNEIDPREELIQRLLEYKAYKEATDELRNREEARSMAFPRGNIEVELGALAEEALADAELESLTLYKLLQAFKRVMERFEEAKRTPFTLSFNTTSLSRKNNR